MKIIAITGSIGCGKTYLSGLLKSMGYCVYNPDEWVRDLYKKDDFLKVIKQYFPQVFINNVFNKRTLRNIVFNDNNQLKKLEKLIHPFLKKELKKFIHRQAKTEQFLFLDIALLFEMHWDNFCDYIIVAYADDETQMQRVIERDKISAEDFQKIISVQIDKTTKNLWADYVIDTTKKAGINKVELIKFLNEVV